jgi:hypothetical protein
MVKPKWTAPLRPSLTIMVDGILTEFKDYICVYTLDTRRGQINYLQTNT